MDRYKKDIKEAINNIDEEIRKLQKQKTLLLSVNQDEIVTEERWHSICETHLRCSDILTEFVKNIFPDAKAITTHANYVYFNLYGYECAIPTSRESGIRVDTRWFHKIKRACEQKREPDSKTDQKFKRYYAAVDANASVMELAKLSVDRPENFSKLKLLMVYIFRLRKMFEENREEFECRMKKNEEKERKDKERRLNYQNEIALFRTKVLPALRTFSKDVKEMDESLIWTEKDVINEIENFNLEDSTL